MPYDISQSILQALAEQSRIVRLPLDQVVFSKYAITEPHPIFKAAPLPRNLLPSVLDEGFKKDS